MEHLKLILDVFRTHNIILYILLISSGVITFDVFGLRLTLGIDNIGQPYLALIGILFIISVSCFIFLIINGLFGGLSSKIKSYLEERKFKKEIDGIIGNLSEKEIVVLSLFLIESSDTIWLPMQAPETTSLISKQLIYMSSIHGRGMSNGMQIFHYSIRPEVKEKFRLKLSNDFKEPWLENFEIFYRQNAPAYLDDLARHKSIFSLS